MAISPETASPAPPAAKTAINGVAISGAQQATQASAAIPIAVFVFLVVIIAPSGFQPDFHFSEKSCNPSSNLKGKEYFYEC